MTDHSLKKIAIVAAMHGDEIYGIELYDEFCKRYPLLAKDNVKLFIGNERAHKRNTRYIDEDMNRIYGSENESHESLEVARLDQELQDFVADYIIDIHTTKRSSGIFFISDIINKDRQDIINMLDIDVCIMKDSVIKRSFIGNHHNAVSLEYSLRDISHKTTEQFVEALKRLVTSDTKSLTNKKLYEAKSLISMDQWKQ